MNKVIFVAPDLNGRVIIGFGLKDEAGRSPEFLRKCDGLEQMFVATADVAGGTSSLRMVESSPLLPSMQSNGLLVPEASVGKVELSEMGAALPNAILAAVADTISSQFGLNVDFLPEIIVPRSVGHDGGLSYTPLFAESFLVVQDDGRETRIESLVEAIQSLVARKGA